MRSGGYVRSGRRRLILRQAAADGFEIQPALLGRLDGAAHRLAQERRDDNSSLLHIQHDRAGAAVGDRLRRRWQP